jgi:AcrR family transcriptional regulator
LQEEDAVTGLRDRKKARTRADIQRHALRLFRAQGFAATTVEQVAAAAEVSPSTVFRYFATKDDLAVLDGSRSLAAVIPPLFAAQPVELTAVQALRATLRAAFAALPPDQASARLERDIAILQVPELWAANSRLVVRGLEALGELVAQRAGRDRHDPAVRTFTGAVLGVTVQVLLDAGTRPDADPLADLDAALARLEAGLPV